MPRGDIDLIISDYRMPGLTGLEFLQLLQREGYDIPLIMLTGYASIEHAVAAIKAGAIDYITKPVRPQQLELAVEQALEFVRLRRENEALRREVMEFRNERQIIGDSPAIRRILQTVAMAAPTRATVLLQGESGTGKELFARALHDQSDRRDKPFIQLNCAALPEGLIESALFGHEKGAFTGAIKRVEGAFERAHRGTLLLDEISEMRLDLQAKLLRVLQEQEFERVGGTSPIKVDVRIIATTNRDLAMEADHGTFRQDLYYRLSTIPILIPPLRDRPEDIPVLALRFAMRVAAELGKKIEGHLCGRPRRAAAVSVARQRARAAACRGAGGDPEQRVDAHPGCHRRRALWVGRGQQRDVTHATRRCSDGAQHTHRLIACCRSRRW
ncbi:MAG: sigma-54 dependent transcriptional regulator [Gemmatimonadaceae bacterium]|nr:sigma-54 dependent transcriptional regulator [Gemmatimonadaceae bacterium]